MLENINKQTNEKMEKSLHHLMEDFKTVRSGRANPSLVENIVVEYYGNKTPLKQMSSITSPESKLIVIQPWDQSVMGDVEKAILSSDIGVTPSNDGRVIRLAFPALNEEQRNNLAKIVHKKGEDSKVSVRNIRRDSIQDIDKAEKDKNISEDEAERGKKEIQKFTDDYIKKIDDIIKRKSEEIMEV
ncbi:MAG: ribosome recycling factor [Spirochaetes bacterium]|nr:ribosome recycling factor [Spirochaetota bacterium]